jgi:ferredoxin
MSGGRSTGRRTREVVALKRDVLDEFEVDITKCMHCGACVGSCPANAIFMAEVVLRFDDNCTLCKRCVKVCPVGAISHVEGD